MSHSYFFIVIVAIFAKVTANFPEFLKVDLKSTGSKEVTLSITRVEESDSQLTFPCVLLYYATVDGLPDEKKVTVPSFEKSVFNVTITGLHPDTNYTVLAKSGNQIPFKVLTFKTVSSSSGTTTSSGPVVEFKEKQLFSATTLDIVLGVLFGVVALCIVCVTSLYLYRRYQRRQRIRNFLRTPHTDPFESLQDYME